MSNLVPIGWEIKNIESILDKVIDYRGKSPPKSNSGVPLITAKNIRKGFINEDPREYIPTEQFEKWMTKGLPENGDIFITTEAPLGNVARVPEYLFAIGQRVLTLRVKKNVVDSEFLLHVMQGREFREQLDLQSTGSTVAGIKQSTFRLMLLVLPPLPEQQKIAAILTSVDEVIEKTQAQINKIKDLKTGMMQELLTRGVGVDGKPHTEFKDSPVGRIPKAWDCCLLDKMARRGSGHTPDKQKSEYWNDGIKWVSLTDSSKLDNLYIHDTSKKISQLGIENSSATLHPKGTVVMARDAGIGKSAIMTSSMAVSQHFMAWVCSDELDNYFLYYLLQHWKSKFEAIAMGSTIKTIGLPYFKKLQIPVPQLIEQKLISSSLKSIDEKVFILKRKHLQLNNTKKALMQDLLTGKVRVKVDIE